MCRLYSLDYISKLRLPQTQPQLDQLVRFCCPITATVPTAAPVGPPPRQTLLVRDTWSSNSELAAQDQPIQEAHPSPHEALHAQKAAL